MSVGNSNRRPLLAPLSLHPSPTTESALYLLCLFDMNESNMDQPKQQHKSTSGPINEGRAKRIPKAKEWTDFVVYK